MLQSIGTFFKLFACLILWCLFKVIYFFVHTSWVLLISLTVANMSIAAFLIARYRQGDEPPSPDFPKSCWHALSVSVCTLLLCVVAPFFRVLRKVRWACWLVTFGLWISAAVTTTREMRWKKEYENQYCDIVKPDHCGQVVSVSTFSILLIMITLWHIGEFSLASDSYDKPPVDFQSVWRRWQGEHERDEEIGMAQIPTLPGEVDVPAPITTIGPAEHQSNAPSMNLGSLPGPPEVAHLKS